MHGVRAPDNPWQAVQKDQALTLKRVQDDMRAKLGHLESRVRVHSLAEVLERNAAGACWLILDGAPQLKKSIAPPRALECVRGGSAWCRQPSHAR